jgi:hypothetical protein
MGIGGWSARGAFDATGADPDVPGALFKAQSVKFARSTDGGVTWADLLEVPAETVGNALGYRFSGDFGPEITLNVVALASGQNEGSVIALGDGWLTWNGYPLGASVVVVASENGTWRAAQVRDLLQPAALAVDRASNLALAGGVPTRGSGLYRSNASGVGWTAVGAFDSIAIKALAIATVDEPWSRVYVGANERLFSSIDGGETWQGNAALGKAEVFAVGVDQGGSGLLWASTSNGLFRSTDAGASWEKSELPDEFQASVIVVDPKKDGRACLIDRNVRRENRLRLWTSVDRRRSWFQVASQPERISDLALYPITCPRPFMRP